MEELCLFSIANFLLIHKGTEGQRELFNRKKNVGARTSGHKIMIDTLCVEIRKGFQVLTQTILEESFD